MNKEEREEEANRLFDIYQDKYFGELFPYGTLRRDVIKLIESSTTQESKEEKKCPNCSRAWDIEKHNACECGASIGMDRKKINWI